MSKLFTPLKSAKQQADHRIAMAPLTRNRAVGNVPNEMMAEYYALRADSALIVTEGTSPSPNGLGYPNIPGVFSAEQVAGWKKVTEAVHAKGGRIFLQVMHTGRVSHPDNLPEGGEVVAPSAVAAAGQMFTAEGPTPLPVPKAMTKADIEHAQQEYVQAAKNAIEAGFDGIEFHSANGYLPNQFLNTRSNVREDEYGGSVENRCRFVLETVQKVVEAIGADRVGIRLSPYGTFNDLVVYDEIPATYEHLVDGLDKLGLAYLHLVDTKYMGAEGGPAGFVEGLAERFSGAVLFNGGWITRLEEAEELLAKSERYFLSFGAIYLANPDLVTRLKQNAPLNEPDQSTFYTPGEEGYLTYPTLEEQAAS